MPQDILFIGGTRFSMFLPDSQKWNLATGADSAEEYRNQLFDPQRLAERLDIFLNLSVPQLAEAARRHRLRHIVHVTPDLPTETLTALRGAAERHDFLEVFSSNSEAEHDRRHRELVRQLAPIGQDMVPFIWYRLDDDDLISAEVFDRAEPYAIPEHAGYVLSFGRGYTASYSHGHLWDLREWHRPMTSVGQMYISAYHRVTDTFLEPPRYNHAKIDRWAPTILDSRQHSFMTVLHEGQDGHTRGEGVDAAYAMWREQGSRPYAQPGLTFHRMFPQLPPERLPWERTLLRPGQGEPVALTVEPSVFAAQTRPGPLAVDYSVTIEGQLPKDGRVFIGLHFPNGHRPQPVGPWKVFGETHLVIGIPATTRMIGRVMYMAQDDATPDSISVWHSKSLQDTPVILRRLAYQTPRRQQG